MAIRFLKGAYIESGASIGAPFQVGLSRKDQTRLDISDTLAY
jgi:hypothetical protein